VKVDVIAMSHFVYWHIAFLVRQRCTSHDEFCHASTAFGGFVLRFDIFVRLFDCMIVDFLWNMGKWIN
jgi:hypothetical protein